MSPGGENIRYTLFGDVTGAEIIRNHRNTRSELFPEASRTAFYEQNYLDQTDSRWSLGEGGLVFRIDNCFIACINVGIQIDSDGAVHPFVGTGGGLAFGATASVGSASKKACDRNPSSAELSFVYVYGGYAQVGHPNDLTNLDTSDTEIGATIGFGLEIPLPGLSTGPTHVFGC